MDTSQGMQSRIQELPKGIKLFNITVEANSIGLYIELTMENIGFRILIGTQAQEEMVITLIPISN